ncbi:glycosyltransferase family 2 protein [Campylobacter molothri]|uniref:glycosyltransferase family 2 protein n=1 Tax=Campylobacter molothri TaxID=1032242 RepID=UPI001EFB2855|nr:glycosyltransferase family 2 protein [Campylobacter sp. RM10537]MBZ7949046.1 glycosyltransferase family 2 protein [Campylobacter sp. RM10534]ULO00006.1 glycosyltransferase, family 2 [Campylobacter sp. RM10537]
MPKISIILPTYNVEPYIERALQSCINQTFKDIEIIVVDDCGNDKSIEIAKDYANKDERIKIIHNEKNLGTFASRNIGVFNSNADYIMFLDPDDYLELNACEICLINIKDNNLLQFGFKKNESNKISFLYPKVKNYEEFEKKINQFFYMPWNLWFLMVKKDFFIKRIQKIHRRFVYAEDMLVYILLINEKMIFIKDCLYNYIIRKSSICRENGQKYDIYLEDLYFVLEIIKKMDLKKNILKYYSYFIKMNICRFLYKSHKISYLKYKFLKKKEKFKKICYILLFKISRLRRYR